jgi:hypothetical protein
VGKQLQCDRLASRGARPEDSIRTRQYRFNVLATVKHADNLGRAVYNAVEYDMRTGNY